MGMYNDDYATKMSREDYNIKLKQIEGKKYNFIKIENKYDEYNDKVIIYFATGIVSIIIIFIIVVIFSLDKNNTSIFLYSLVIIPVWLFAFSLNKGILPFFFKKYDKGIAIYVN